MPRGRQECGRLHECTEAAQRAWRRACSSQPSGFGDLTGPWHGPWLRVAWADPGGCGRGGCTKVVPGIERQRRQRAHLGSARSPSSRPAARGRRPARCVAPRPRPRAGWAGRCTAGRSCGGWGWGAGWGWAANRRDAVGQGRWRASAARAEGVPAKLEQSSKALISHRQCRQPGQYPRAAGAAPRAPRPARAPAHTLTWRRCPGRAAARAPPQTRAARARPPAWPP